MRDERCAELLRDLADGRFCSGASLAVRYGVSRTTIAQCIRQIEAAFRVHVHKVPGRGYRLLEPLDLLLSESIYSKLSSDDRGRLAALEVRDKIDSTNSYLLSERVSLGRRYHVVFAERQTAGRGRSGREWVSPFGRNILMSVGWRTDCSMRRLGGLSLIVGLAVVDALKSLGFSGIGLKWPNDLYWEARKLGGILVEVAGEADGPVSIVIGIGLNCHLDETHGRRISQPFASLKELSRRVDRNHIAAAILAVLFRMLSLYMENGFAHFHADWQRLDILSGLEVNVFRGKDTSTGVYLGVDSTGSALVNVGGQVHVLSGGEISLRRNRGASGA